MAAEALTLESLGVNLDELARRIGDLQTASSRDDATCAKLAGVSEERFRAWKSGNERPGVARVPKLADALATTPPSLLFGVGAPAPSPGQRSDFTRRAAALAADIPPHVDALMRLAADASDNEIPIPGGAMLAGMLEDVATILRNHAATLPPEPQS